MLLLLYQLIWNLFSFSNKKQNKTNLTKTKQQKKNVATN